jgi:hypothetical protein
VFNTGSDEWFELRPVTKEERLGMNRFMTMCTETNQTGLRPVKPRHHARLDHLLVGVEHGLEATDNPLRKEVDRLVKEYKMSRMSRFTVDNKGKVKHDADNIAEQCASIHAVGTIMANLTETSQRARGVNADPFCTFEPAPEYAIERGRSLTGNASFFEEDTGGFYNAPSRLARDPRFRSDIKDAITKLKGDEEWKYRVDMFGRRRPV